MLESGDTTVLKIGKMLLLHLECGWDTDTKHVSKPKTMYIFASQNECYEKKYRV